MIVNLLLRTWIKRLRKHYKPLNYLDLVLSHLILDIYHVESYIWLRNKEIEKLNRKCTKISISGVLVSSICWHGLCTGSNCKGKLCSQLKGRHQYHTCLGLDWCTPPFKLSLIYYTTITWCPPRMFPCQNWAIALKVFLCHKCHLSINFTSFIFAMSGHNRLARQWKKLFYRALALKNSKLMQKEKN